MERKAVRLQGNLKERDWLEDLRKCKNNIKVDLNGSMMGGHGINLTQDK
jgi:hypothetical protein